MLKSKNIYFSNRKQTGQNPPDARSKSKKTKTRKTENAINARKTKTQRKSSLEKNICFKINK